MAVPTCSGGLYRWEGTFWFVSREVSSFGLVPRWGKELLESHGDFTTRGHEDLTECASNQFVVDSGYVEAETTSLGT